MAEQSKKKSLQNQLRQTNERLLLSAFDARESADRAHEALALLEAVLHQMPCGVIIVDPSSDEITLSNQRAQSLWPGCTRVSDMARYLETNCFHLDGVRCTADELPLFRSMRTGKPVTHEGIRFARSDGSHGTMNIDSGAVRNTDGEIIAVVVTCEDITEQKALAEREEAALLQLRALSAKLESAREEERTRIAREIHDELGQSLTGLNLDLAWLLKKTRMEGKVVREKIRSMIEASTRTIHSVRRLASELRPSILDDLGLIPAIEWQLSKFQGHTGIRATLKYHGDGFVDPESSTAVFRIVQEALTNVMRHAEATKVSVTLKIDHERLLLHIADDGRGISTNETASPTSLGIAGMNARVIRLGGEFKVGPGLPSGTRLDVVIPLNRNSH